MLVPHSDLAENDHQPMEGLLLSHLICEIISPSLSNMFFLSLDLVEFFRCLRLFPGSTVYSKNLEIFTTSFQFGYCRTFFVLLFFARISSCCFFPLSLRVTTIFSIVDRWWTKVCIGIPTATFGNLVVLKN